MRIVKCQVHVFTAKLFVLKGCGFPQGLDQQGFAWLGDGAGWKSVSFSFMTTAAKVTAEVAVVPEWSTAKAAIWASRLCAAGLGAAKVIAVVDVSEHRGSPCVSHRAWGVKRLALHHN